MCSQLFTLLLLALSLTLVTCLEPTQTTTFIASTAPSKEISRYPKYILVQFITKKVVDNRTSDEVAKNDSMASQQNITNYILFTDSKKSWNESSMDCRARGMDLASIENEDEYKKVMEKVNSTGIRPDRMDFWISGKRQGDEGRWFKWMTNGHNVTYNQWSPGQPSLNKQCMYTGDDLELCIEINQEFHNKWNDFCCSHPQYYICQTKF